MEEVFEHNGHTVHVELREWRKGLFKWTVTIDGHHYFECDDRPMQNRALMLAEGKAAGRHAAEGMPPKAG